MRYFFVSDTGTLDARLTTLTTERQVDRYGWTMSDAVVQRQILMSVNMEDGVSTTVNIAKMLLSGATLVCSRETST